MAAKIARSALNHQPGLPMVAAMMTTTLPPPQFDHPFHGRVVIEHRLAMPCGGVSCAQVRNGVCYLPLPASGYSQQLMAILRRHEIAHCNGWSAAQEGAHAITLDDNGRIRQQHKGLNLELQ